LGHWFVAEGRSLLGSPWDTYLRNLVAKTDPTHTRLTYHRTWETGLRVAIRVTTFSPAFFCPDILFSTFADLLATIQPFQLDTT